MLVGGCFVTSVEHNLQVLGIPRLQCGPLELCEIRMYNLHISNMRYTKCGDQVKRMEVS